MGEQSVSAVGEEWSAFELDVWLEHDRWSPVVASGTSFFVLSRLTVVQHFLGLVPAWPFTGSSSVAVTQQEGNPILIISVQRHSARSRATFHCARECCIPVGGVHRASSLELLVVCAIEACAMVLRHCSACNQRQVFDQGRTLPYHRSMNR